MASVRDRVLAKRRAADPGMLDAGQDAPPAAARPAAGGHAMASSRILPGPATAMVQRSPEDPAQAAAAANAQADGLSAGAGGATTVQAPALAFDIYHAATLAELAGALPTEPGSLTFNIAASTSGDPITSATVTVTQEMRLPRWAERDTQCPPVQRAWDRFSNALRQHEDGHAAINRRELGGAHTQFAGKPVAETQSVVASLEQAANTAGAAFDAHTDHGRTGTPPTTIDLDATCANAGMASVDGSASGIELPEPAQAKLEVSQPGDPEEEEADRIADEVMRMPDAATHEPRRRSATVQRQCDDCAAEDRQEEEDEDESAAARPIARRAAESSIDGAAGGPVTAVTARAGEPLDAGTRAFMEPRFGFDFAHVRIHTGDEATLAARSVNAQAYTLGQHIVFGAGRYRPQSAEGGHLLAHELAHTIQQGGGVQLRRKEEPPPARGDQESPTVVLAGGEGQVVGSPPIPEAATPPPPTPDKVPASADAPLRPAEAGAAVLGGAVAGAAPSVADAAPAPGVGAAAGAAVGGAMVSPAAPPAITGAAADPVGIGTAAGAATAAAPSAAPVPDGPGIDATALPGAPMLSAVIQQIAQSVEAEKAALRAQLLEQKAGLTTAAEAKVQSIATETENRVQAVVTEIEARKAQVRQEVEATRGAITADSERQQATAQADGDAAIDALRREAAAKQQAAAAAADEHAVAADKIGEAESERARSSTASSAERVTATANAKATAHGRDAAKAPAIRQAVTAAANKIIGKIQETGAELAGAATQAAQRLSGQFRAAGTTLSEALGGKTGEAEQAIRDGVRATAVRIATAATQRLGALDGVQTQAVDALEQLKNNVVPALRQAGETAATMARQTVATAAGQIDDAGAQAAQQFDGAANQITSELRTAAAAGGDIPEDQAGELATTIADQLVQLRDGASAGVRNVVDAIRTQVDSLVDDTVVKLGGSTQKVIDTADQAVTAARDSLAKARQEVEQFCAGAVSGNRGAAEAASQKFLQDIQGKVDEARAGWAKEKEAFHTDLRSQIDKGLKSHTDAEQKAPADLDGVARNAAEPKSFSFDLKGFLEGLAEVALGILAIVALAAVIWLVIAGLAALGVVSAVPFLVVLGVVAAFALIGIFLWFFWQRLNEMDKAMPPDAPWYLWVAGICGALLIAAMDTIGVAAIYEGWTNRSMLTGRELNLSDEDRTRKVTAGALTLILVLLGAFRAAKGKGAPGGEKPIERPVEKPVDKPVEKPSDKPPEKPTVIEDPYTALGKKHNLTADQVSLMRESGADPVVLDRILARKVDADTVALVAKDHGDAGLAVLDSLSANGMDTKLAVSLIEKAAATKNLDALARLARDGSLPRLLRKGIPEDDLVGALDEFGKAGVDPLRAAEVVEGLMAQGEPPGPALNVARLAARTGTFDSVHALVTTRNLTNVKALEPKLESIAKGDAGGPFELQVAAEAARKGDQVALEQGADVANLTAREAVQAKDVSSPSRQTAEDNMVRAADQLSGSTGEQPPVGPDGRPFTRVIEIRIKNPQSELFDADRVGVSAFVRNALAGKTSVDRVRFTNNRGTETFEGPDFNP